jgi:two-component system, NtrC family, sensor histidine kinase KinB
MNTSIRSKRFTMGIILFLVIILLLSVLSAFYLNRLSGKTSAILKENHYSVVFARDMSQNLTIINQEITNCFLTNKNPDVSNINKEIKLFVKSLQSEQNNITEMGEDNLVSGIETGFNEYRDSVLLFIKSPKPVSKILYLQNKFDTLYQQLTLLSQMNERAIEEKTSDAKVSAKKAAIQMSFIATFCFLIAYGFTFSFASYFNERFYQLYNGIKEIVASNYSHRLIFTGKDEISEVSLIINEMADKINEKTMKMSATLQVDLEREIISKEEEELNGILFRLKNLEEQVVALLSGFEKSRNT